MVEDPFFFAFGFSAKGLSSDIGGDIIERFGISHSLAHLDKNKRLTLKVKGQPAGLKIAQVMLEQALSTALKKVEESTLKSKVAMTEPHYYQYRFTSKGRGKSAQFELEARGDLDCDGNISSYRRIGGIEPDGSLRIQGPIIDKETE